MFRPRFRLANKTFIFSAREALFQIQSRRKYKMRLLRYVEEDWFRKGRTGQQAVWTKGEEEGHSRLE
jgi:hypothetical protein